MADRGLATAREVEQLEDRAHLIPAGELEKALLGQEGSPLGLGQAAVELHVSGEGLDGPLHCVEAVEQSHAKAGHQLLARLLRFLLRAPNCGGLEPLRAPRLPKVGRRVRPHSRRRQRLATAALAEEQPLAGARRRGPAGALAAGGHRVDFVQHMRGHALDLEGPAEAILKHGQAAMRTLSGFGRRSHVVLQRSAVVKLPLVRR
mmetsp:Transcript_68017/g.196972  ORF Transcript_68017/g.196972 Transcript_68017/m.196972 type:complete len:204 (+) Transcript_68017:1969-2580(+)